MDFASDVLLKHPVKRMLSWDQKCTPLEWLWTHTTICMLQVWYSKILLSEITIVDITSLSYNW